MAKQVNASDLKSDGVILKGSTPFTPINYYTAIAIKSKHPKYKHAAIVFHNQEIICHANNSNDQHAEVRALEIARILGYTRDLTLLSLRVTKTGKLALAKPCFSCFLYIKLTGGVSKILHSNERGMIVKYGEKRKRRCL